MPWWVGILISLAVKFGLPAIAKHLSPDVLKFIQGILEHLGGATSPSDATARLGQLKRACQGEGCKL